MAATDFGAHGADHLLSVQTGACLERSRDRRLGPQREVRRLLVAEQAGGALGPVVRRFPGRLPQELTEPREARLVHLLLDPTQRRYGVEVGVRAPLLPADPRLFADATPSARPLKPRPFAREADLRRFAERRHQPPLGLRWVASEVAVDGWLVGRIDALAVDEGLRPAVLEFKREATGNTIGHALAYLDWVLAHRDAIALVVARELGVQQADRIDLSAPRLVCVAGAFGPREEAVARQFGGRVELVRLLRYGRGLFVVQRV